MPHRTRDLRERSRHLPPVMGEREFAPNATARSTGTTKRVWALAWPAILTNLLQSAVGFVGAAVVSRHLGTAAISATGVGGRIFFMQQVVLMAVTTGTMALVARAWGAGDRSEAERVTRTSLWLCGGLALIVMLPCIVFAHALVGVFGLDGPTTELAATYVRWVSLSSLPFAAGMVIATALRAAGDTRTPLWISIAGAGLTIAALWMLVGGGLGVTSLGVKGAAIASSLGALLGATISWWLWRTNRLAIGPAPGGSDFDRARISRLFRIGIPAGAEGLGFQVGFVGFIWIIARYGNQANAAYQLGVNLLAFSFLVGQAFSIAASTLVGQHLGAGDEAGAERSGWRAMTLAIGVMVVFGGFIIGFSEPLARYLSPSDPEVVRLTVAFIWVLGSVQALMAIEFTLGGALRGAGDTIFPFITVLSGLSFGRLAFAALFMSLGKSIEWVYAALIADYIIKGVLFVSRFRSGRWKAMLGEREESFVLGDAPETEAG
jgi:putative MATE family efflux protein